MDKKEVARILEEIGTFLELKGENSFKVRAYYNAARAIEATSDDLHALAKEEKLDEIPGVGKGIAEKISELLKRGRSSYHEELKKEIPTGILDMLEIPSVGPKRAKLLHDKLGISSLGELEYACKENRLLDLEGFGEKSQEKILEGIRYHKHHKEYHLYDQALEAAQAILGRLESHRKVQRVSIAGSLRRRKEIIRDIDFLVSSKEPTAVMNYFTSLDAVQKVDQKGETKSIVILKSGIQADLRVVSDKEFPYALHHLTGSKEHNVAMRSRAQKRKMKMNEYGLFKVSGPKERLIPCKDEEEIFKALGLRYIEPELRENMGEIEAAEKGKLPDLVGENDIRGVFHVHSMYSDGADRIEALAKKAKILGYEYLGLSDHSKTAYYAHGLDETRLKQQQKEIDEVNKKVAGIKILKGAEVDILPDGTLDYPDRILKALDFVIISIHSRFNMPETEMTNRILKAMRHPSVTLFAHPTGRLLLAREPYAVNLEKLFGAAKEHGVAIELNGNPHRLDLDWRYIKLAKEIGVRFAINPDAHHLDGLADTRFGVGIARKGWLEKEDILNTLPLSKLTPVLEKKRLN